LLLRGKEKSEDAECDSYYAMCLRNALLGKKI
jgi:hypothetical protein